MRQLIVFPGNSPKNKAWGEAVVERYGSWFDNVYMQSYAHWESGEEFIDFATELEKLKSHIAHTDEDTKYFIFAKSIGTILSLFAVQENILTPERCVFFGMPLDIVESQNTFNEDWSPLSLFNIPALAFHNENDPTASYVFTKEKLEEYPVSSIELIPTVGDDHGYFEFETYTPRIQEFLSL